MTIKKTLLLMAPLSFLGISSADVILETDFTAAQGYVDGNLQFQNGWLGQALAQVDATAGTVTSVGGPFDRNCYNVGARGGTSGVPTTIGDFQPFDTIRITVGYSFILPSDGNTDISRVGIRPDGPNAGNGFNSAPTEGLEVQFNVFDSDPLVADDGSVKFYPNFNDAATNATALILDGALMGISPGTADGSAVDLESDQLTIEYLITRNATGGFDITSFTVTNDVTALSYTYAGNPLSFTWSDVDAFYAQQLAFSGNAALSGTVHSVKFEYDTAPLVREVFCIDYTAAEGYVDGNLQFQNGWLGQAASTVDTTGTGTVTSGTFTRNMYGDGFRGGTGGVGTTTGDFTVGESIEIIFDYQFTLGLPENDSLGAAGLRFEGPNAGNNFESGPTEGFDMSYNGFDPDPLVSDDGNVKFYPDLKDTDNADAMILEGSDVGISPGTADGSAVDLVSDNLRITYTLLIDEDPVGADGIWDGLFTVSSFTVENLDTATTYTYTGPVQSFQWDDGFLPYQDAFFSQQLARSSKGSVGVTDRVKVNFLAVPTVPSADLKITSAEIVGSDLVVTFEGTPGADYKLTESADLVTDFVDTDPLQSTTTDGTTGVGTLMLPVSGTSNYVRVEDN